VKNDCPNWRVVPQSELDRSPSDGFAGPQQVDVLNNLLERDHFHHMADLALDRVGHDLAQVVVVGPEGTVIGVFPRHKEKEGDIDVRSPINPTEAC